MAVKLPRPVARAVQAIPRGSLRPASSSAGAFRIRSCTTNLGATAHDEGDERLPHCLVEIADASGATLRRVSLGRRGLGVEANAEVPSRRCDSTVVPVDAAGLRRFEQELRRCADEGYAWGERDCCSCIERAFVRGLGRAAPPSIAGAAATLAAVPDPFTDRDGL